MPDRFVVRLALFYGAFFVYLGLSMPFIPAWLAAKGLDAREIGIVLAAPMLVRVIAVPLATRTADRFGILHGALIAASFASATENVAGSVIQRRRAAQPDRLEIHRSRWFPCRRAARSAHRHHAV